MKEVSALLKFFEKIRYNYGEDAAHNMKVLDYETFDFSPEMAMFSMSYTVHKTFERNSTTPGYFDNAICFYFKNVVQVSGTISSAKTGQPVVHIFPYPATRISTFKKGEKVQLLCLIIRIPYLQALLGAEADNFAFLLNNYHHFLIEEILTEDIIRLVSAIIHSTPQEVLTDFHYRIISLQLIFSLFKRLSKRGQIKFQKLNERDVVSIYKVKETLVHDLSQPVSIAELSRIAGMNINKMRKLFVQVFGLGIYEYFQQHRMLEAAKLLKDQQMSVSEVGYSMGFENLSHFTRMFERYIGMKPKAYSMMK
jgi:AraC-like DNA-binding protein